MKGTTRRAEFFVVEAEEYLLDLESVSSPQEAPDAERMVRGARALRGAALVAGLGTLARVAAGLEALARKLRGGTLEWDLAVRQQSLATIASLKAMLPRVAVWDATADSDALVLAERIERFAGGSPTRPAAQSTPVLTAGVRAFIAKESALIASSLERAARALSPMPPPEALTAVLERMRSLRGLGAAADLSPLPEMLDAMEIATRTLLSEVPPPPDVAMVFDEAARALAAMARAIADNGQVIIPPELDRVAAHLLSSYAEEPDVVLIAELAPAGEESVAQRGTAPAPPPDAIPVPIELVGVGDHLQRASETLAKAAPAVVRDLRLFVLHRTLATMPARSATGQFLAPLTTAINSAIGRGAAGRYLDRFMELLRNSGRFLMESGSSHDLPALARERDHLAAMFSREELRDVPTYSPIPVEAAPVFEPVIAIETILFDEPVVPIELLAPTDVLDDVVAIESLAPDEIIEDVVSIESLAPSEPIEEFVSIDSLAPDEEVEEIVPIESLAHDEDLVGTPIVPIEALSPDAIHFPFAGLIPQEAPGEASRLELAWRAASQLVANDVTDSPSLEHLLQQDIIPITSLLYRGSAALARAAEINAAIVATLAEPTASLDVIREELKELFDLVALARDAA